MIASNCNLHLKDLLTVLVVGTEKTKFKYCFSDFLCVFVWCMVLIPAQTKKVVVWVQKNNLFPLNGTEKAIGKGKSFCIRKDKICVPRVLLSCTAPIKSSFIEMNAVLLKHVVWNQCWPLERVSLSSALNCLMLEWNTLLQQVLVQPLVQWSLDPWLLHGTKIAR